MRQIHLLFLLLFVSMAHVVSAQAGNDGELGLVNLNASIDEVVFVKVTDVSTLQDGDVVIIVNDEAGKAMGKYNSSKPNYRSAKDVTITDGIINDISEDVDLVTLEKTGDLWYLKTTSGYLYANNKSSNYLNTSTEKKDKFSQASITLNSNATYQTRGEVVILFQGGSLYRSNLQYSSGRFSCYQQIDIPVSIYRLTSSSTPTETVSLTIGSTGYASLYYSDKALRVANGLVAQTYKVVQDRLFVSKTYIAGEVIPADMGVVFKGAQGSYQLVVTSETGERDDANLLKGSDVDAMTEGDGLFYKLSTYQGKNIGFYWAAEDGGPFVSKAHKAYLMVPFSVNAKGFVFDETTGIQSVNMVPSADAKATETYNLVGQRVEGTQVTKGIYIVNGRKVVIR